ncbi:phosphatidylglycerophosphate phosphatase PTPMT2-like [Impatiens glandulifera]|uniref:phosphatidylglycerophosphate phosphatase PTPMT2-like n=1 Tax=Impatiens glandulifera TaxID=253017 RepID=UPI001FB09DF4|nr:phosphatidylglycerophosphate phosphatase PTPMT2-like [Impatiens glandulifera]
MHIEQLNECGETESVEDQLLFNDLSPTTVLVWDTKRVLVGAGARALFYPTLLYNVVRNKIQSEFRWWDEIDQFVLLGAVPFPADVPRLKSLGVHGVVTLNESYETLVHTSLYHAYGIDHLVIPTRDYLFAPSLTDICQAVDFIHDNASRGLATYVHCKAGRGRSTTIVLCYLVKHKHMTPDVAYQYVKSIRPRVLLASAQRQAVQDYYNYNNMSERTDDESSGRVLMKITRSVVGFEEEDGSVVVITESDLNGYDENNDDNVRFAKLSVACRVQFARLSCIWLRCHGQNVYSKELESSVGTTSIRVY